MLTLYDVGAMIAATVFLIITAVAGPLDWVSFAIFLIAYPINAWAINKILGK